MTKFGSTIYSEGTDFTPPPPLLEHTSYFKTHVSRAIGDIQAVNAATGHASAYDAAFVDFRQSAGIDIGFGADPGGNIMYAQLQQLGRQQHAESYHLHNSPKLPQSQNQTDRKRNQQVQKTRSSDNVISKLREEDFYSTVGAGTGLCTVASAVAGHGNDFSVPAPSRYHEGRTEQRDVRHGFDEDAYFRQLSRDHARVKVESSQLGSGYGLHEHSQQQRAPLQQYQHPTFQQSQMPHHRHQQHQQYHEVQHNQQQRLHAQAGQGLSPSIRHLSPSSRPGLSFGAIGEKGRYQPQQISGTVRQQNLLQQQWRQQLQQQQQQILWQQQQQEHQLQQQALLHQQQQQQQGQGHQLQHSYMRNQQTPIDSNDYFGGLAASVTSYPSGTQSLLQHNQLHSIQALHQHRQQSVLQPPVPPQQQSPQQQSQQQSQQQGKFAFGNYL